MPTDFDSIDDSTSASEIAAALSADLFPEAVPTDKNPSASSPSAGGERDEVAPVVAADKDRAETGKSTDETPAVGAVPVESSASVSAPLPKSWKRELAPVWEAASPEIKAYVETREKAMLEGLSQYQQGHNAWGETISPFLPVLREHPDVNPVQLFQTLARNHLAILQASPDQKLAIASRLLESYGIPIPSGKQAQTPESELPAEFLQMRQELAQTRQVLQQLQAQNQSQQQASQQQKLAANEKVVADFFADPANTYAEEVGDDIARYLRVDPGMGLPAAYRLACAANPVVQAKIAALQAAPAGKINGKPAPLNISDSGEAKPKPRKSRDWQSGVDEIVAASYSNSL